MKVTNMTSPNGNKVANQFIITGDDGSLTFQKKIDSGEYILTDLN